VTFKTSRGFIHANLTIGANVAAARALKSNAKLAYMGVIPVGRGFRVSGKIAADLGLTLGSQEIRRYLGGSDLTDNAPFGLIIDVNHLSEAELETGFPSVHSHLKETVYPHRAVVNRSNHKTYWWRYGEARGEMRRALAGLRRFVATTETSKHRWFTFLPADVLPDQKIRVIALQDAFHLGVLSSRVHVLFANAASGRQGAGNDYVYNHTVCFDPFPFPSTPDEAVKDRIRDAAEKLDALRKDVLARHADLTLTKLYNVLDALRAVEMAATTLSEKDRDVAIRGCVSLIRQHHATIDAAVAEAYGWPADLSDDEILERIVALNKERAAEEAKGKVRWLRPDFQQPGYAAPEEQKTLALPQVAQPSADILEWPKSLPEQFTAVAAVVDRAARPIAANDVARAFKGKRASTLEPVLDALAGMGRVRKLEDGRYAA
jgi:hypothetical protein